MKSIEKPKKSVKATAQNQQNAKARRFRPLGLSIAILASAGLYGLWPLVPLLLLLLTRLRGRDIGVEIIDTAGWLNSGLAVFTLVACVAAWIGRPPQTRRVMLVLVWLETALRIVEVAQTVRGNASITAGQVGGNLSSVLQPINLCQLPLLIIVPLYITWYMNRAPARAFFNPA